MTLATFSYTTCRNLRALICPTWSERVAIVQTDQLHGTFHLVFGTRNFLLRVLL